MVPEMFYRFCGISKMSDSNTRMSKSDFETLLKCLSLDPLVDEFLKWFPKPPYVNLDHQPYISIDKFSEFMGGQFAQCVVESRAEYETLTSALLTMRCLDTKGTGRLDYQQFYPLYESLHGPDEEGAKRKYKEYTAFDKNGFLNIYGIYMLCSEEEVDDEVGDNV